MLPLIVHSLSNHDTPNSIPTDGQHETSYCDIFSSLIYPDFLWEAKFFHRLLEKGQCCSREIVICNAKVHYLKQNKITLM